MPVGSIVSDDAVKTEQLSDSHHLYLEVPRSTQDLRVASPTETTTAHGGLASQLDKDKLQSQLVVKCLGCVCILALSFFFVGPILRRTFPKSTRRLDFHPDSTNATSRALDGVTDFVNSTLISRA